MSISPHESPEKSLRRAVHPNTLPDVIASCVAYVRSQAKTRKLGDMVLVPARRVILTRRAQGLPPLTAEQQVETMTAAVAGACEKFGAVDAMLDTEYKRTAEKARGLLARLAGPGVNDPSAWLDSLQRMPAARRRRLLRHRALRGLWAPDDFPTSPTPDDLADLRCVLRLLDGHRALQVPSASPGASAGDLRSAPGMLAVASLSAAPGAPSLAA